MNKRKSSQKINKENLNYLLAKPVSISENEITEHFFEGCITMAQ